MSSRTRDSEPSRRPLRQSRLAGGRWRLGVVALGVAWISLAIGACSEVEKRPYGGTCGVSRECTTNLCDHGICTRACTDYRACGSDFCIGGRCHGGDRDLDGDGLDNRLELELKLDPLAADTDGDGRPDGLEVGLGAAPTDTNGDGLIDALQSNTKDSDGDCMVDALDTDPFDDKVTNLPTAEEFCDEGACREEIGSVRVVCRPGAPTHRRVFLGCKGCGCEASGTADFQITEATCDGLDNDCDGRTDEGLTWQGLGVGQPCVADAGICALPGPGGAARAGVVECGPAGGPLCSVGLWGSRSLARPERCNRLDDNCDGDTDEPFTFGGLHTGDSCGPCGAILHRCKDGSIANPSVVRCADEGGGAGCASTTFADSFVLVSAGRPVARVHWTAAFMPGWKRLVVYSGAVHTAAGAVARADLWQLDTGSAPAAWLRATGQAPGPREGAALTPDPPGDRLLLVGGRRGAQTATGIYALDKGSKWQELSGVPITDSSYVPPLPQEKGSDQTRAIVVGDQEGRWLVVFARGAAAPMAVRLDGNPGQRSWAALTVPKPFGGYAGLSGEVECATVRPADHRDGYALATGPIGTETAVYRLHASAGGVSVSAALNQGTAPHRTGFGCAVDGDDKLLVVGGHGGAGASEVAIASAVLKGTPAGSAGIGWKTAKGSLAALGRDNPVIAYTGTGHELLVAGGFLRETAGGSATRSGRTDVITVTTDATSITRLDRPAPAARVGEAAGWSSEHGFCIAAGLRFELPAEGASRARLLPATDAWCAEKGRWKRISEKVEPFAFGAAVLDDKAQRLVLAGGLALDAGTAVPWPERLWRAKLTFADDGTGNAPSPTGAVQSISLKDGTQISAPKGPALAAPAAVLDPLRGRMLTFGGFSATRPTLQMWELTLATMKWRELSAKWPGHAMPATDKPLPQYGSLIAYSALDDILLVGAGVQYRYQEATKSWGLTFQLLLPEPGEPLNIDACRGARKTLLWVARTLDLPGIEARAVQTFVDSTADPPTRPLYRPHFGQPAFVPVLHDHTSGRGLVLLPPARRYAPSDDDGKPCADPAAAQWTRTDHAVVFALGQCAGEVEVFPENRALKTVPEAWVLAAAALDSETRTARVFGGLRADETPSSALWSIPQRCANVQP